VLAAPPAATPIGNLDTPTVRQESSSARKESSTARAESDTARHEPPAARPSLFLAARQESPTARRGVPAATSQLARRGRPDTSNPRRDTPAEGRLRPVGPRAAQHTTPSTIPARTGSALANKGKRPGTRRRNASARAFPAIPAVASVATLVAAASGAVTLHSVAAAGGNPTDQNPPAGVALSLGQIQDARDAAAGRADRSRGGPASVDPGINAEAQRAAKLRQQSERERAAWEAQRTRELELIVDKASDATSEQVFKRTIQWFLPLRSFRTSAGFGQAGGLWSADHTGQDFSAPMGTPIRAVGAGEIIFAGWDGPYGNKIVVRHDDGTETWYCHMSNFEYTSGYVSAGTVIGYVGSTGNSTGPHLHFEVRPGGGDPIDPLPWLRGLGLPI
jgi:murein DD-endopeptidase MepM/ murein hydrolase activator NlpD